MNSGIAAIEPNLTNLVNQIFIQNVVPAFTSPYDTNRQYFLDVAAVIANYLDVNMNVIRIELANRILEDYQICLTDFDTLYDQHIADMIDCDGGYPKAIIASLNRTFKSGIAACGACFDRVPELIFPPLELQIDDAIGQISLYGVAAADCNASSLSDPDCYFKIVNH